MRSNFNSVLKLVNGVVQATGPLKWGGGESEAVVTVTISQKDKRVGVACSPPTFAKSDAKWSLTVPPALPNKKFEKGPARASGEISAVGKGLDTIVFQWSETVTLEE